MIELKEKELYQEIDIVLDDVKIGTAEVELNSKILSRLSINEEYRDKGYATQVVKMLNEKYGCYWLLRGLHTIERDDLAGRNIE